MLRITAGQFKGRLIHSPNESLTRPTQSRLRQALFNSLQMHIPESKVLDLFAGSGVLGFEALSRGAEEVVFVEKNSQVIKVLTKNIEALAVKNQTHIVREAAEKCTKAIQKFMPFHIIFADPPYAEGFELKLLNELEFQNILVPGGYFCLEWGLQKSQVKELPEVLPFLVKVREKIYGDSVLTTYMRPTAKEETTL